jgi:hypothetical protein
MSSSRVKLHRFISWWLVVFSIGIIATGYSQARGLFQDLYFLSAVHRLFEIFFLSFLITHVLITLVHFRINWRSTIEKIRAKRSTNINALRVIQRVSSWAIVVFTTLVVLAGLNGIEFFAASVEDTIPFEWHRFFDFFLAVSIIIHVGVGLRFVAIRRRVRGPVANTVVAGIVIVLLFISTGLNLPRDVTSSNNNPFGTGTGYTKTIRDGSYGFSSENITSIRPDIFKPGSFSMFDVLIELDRLGAIELEYHFDSSMNTHVIDSLDELSNLWYGVVYSGGWREGNVFRMDHYPWKEGTTLYLYEVKPSHIEDIYESFREEIIRKQNNNGSIILPRVTIEARDGRWHYYNVSVYTHNLRSDIFQNGTITAIDVIMSMGEQGLITYDVEWYDSIADASVVRSYWVEMLNNRTAHGTCGFVYESGSEIFEGFIGNHIHLPSDSRVINSPYYMYWFWICL